MAIAAVNIFTQKQMFDYENYSPKTEAIQDNSVATAQKSNEMSDLHSFLQNEIAHISGYKDADSMLNTSSLLPKGRDLSNIGGKWKKSEAAATLLSQINNLKSFDTQTDDMIDAGKTAGAEEIKKKLAAEEKELKSLKSQRAQKQSELDQGFVMITTTNSKGETILKKQKLAKKKSGNKTYNKEAWQDAINELDAKIRSKEQLISNYKQRLEYLS